MSQIVLVPGSWHAQWCWELVAPKLRSLDHVVHTPDLPGTAEDGELLASATLESWAVWLADYLSKLPEPVTLVGHSRGGLVISRTAELSPEYVKRLVYVAGHLLQDGQTMLGNFVTVTPPQAVLDHPDIIQVAEDGTSTLAPEGARDCLYQLTPRDIADRAVARLGREAQNVLSEPLRITDARFGRVPRAYIETTQDAILAIELQRNMVSALPCSPVISFETDHSPFLSAPDELARTLDDLARLPAG